MATYNRKSVSLSWNAGRVEAEREQSACGQVSKDPKTESRRRTNTCENTRMLIVRDTSINLLRVYASK